jgi:hypothetical protein
VREFLDQVFQEHWIGRGGSAGWPARSPDLIPLDYFFWGYLKSLVYVEPIGSEEQLRQRIIEACRTVTPEIICRVIRQWMDRMRLCEANNGVHIE